MYASFSHLALQLLSSQLFAVIAVLGLGVTLAHHIVRRREDRRARSKLAEAVRQKLDVPASLHNLGYVALAMGGQTTVEEINRVTPRENLQAAAPAEAASS